MKLSEVFPSNYLKADDLQGREVPVIIREYKMEKMGDENKLVIYFRGKEKGMVCNRTNAERIALFYGDDLTQWLGKGVMLGTELVTFQGKTNKALRIKDEAPSVGHAVATPPAERPVDDIGPFENQ